MWLFSSRVRNEIEMYRNKEGEEEMARVVGHKVATLYIIYIYINIYNYIYNYHLLDLDGGYIV